MRRNPTYDFKDRNAIGIFSAPLESLIHIIDSDGRGKPRMVQIISKNGLNHRSTIGQFLADPSLYIDLDKANEVYSELEKIHQANNDGWRILGRTSSSYGYIGKEAIDLSYATGARSNVGALGNKSFATGTDVIALGENSHAEGLLTAATKSYAHSEGWGTRANGVASHAEGYNTIANNNFMTAVGKFNTSADVGSLFEVGIGTSTIDRKNGLQVFDDGGVVAPNTTEGTVLTHGPKSLVTAEYVENRIVAFDLNDLNDVDLETNLPHPNQVLKYNGTKWTAQADSNTNRVSSVNGEIGDVILDTDDIPEGSTNLYYTDIRAEAAADRRIHDASIDLLHDVDTTGASISQVLAWNGVNWTPSNPQQGTGNLKSDGTVPMDTGYRPEDILDLVTKEYSDLVNGGTF
jgi:hypothetical protein